MTLSKPSENTDEWLQALAIMHEFVDKVAAKADTPEARKGLLAMSKTVTRIGMGPALYSAMLNFGQKSLHSLRATKRSTTIAVQPTAVARRKMPLGGRKRIHPGRPASAMQSAANLPQVAKRRRAPAPHSLSQCVESNRSLGKSH